MKVFIIASVLIVLIGTSALLYNYHPTTTEYYTFTHIDTIEDLFGTDGGTWVFEEGKQPYRLVVP